MQSLCCQIAAQPLPWSGVPRSVVGLAAWPESGFQKMASIIPSLLPGAFEFLVVPVLFFSSFFHSIFLETWEPEFSAGWTAPGSTTSSPCAVPGGPWGHLGQQDGVPDPSAFGPVLAVACPKVSPALLKA